MYEYIRACCRRASSDIYYHPGPQAPQALHRAEQRSQPAQQSAKKVRADQSATTQASRRSWLTPACRRAHIQLTVLTNEVIKICSAYNNIAGGVMRGGFAHTLLYLSFLSFSSIHAASGLFLGTMELLTFASRWFAPKTMDLSVRSSYSHFVTSTL